MVARRRAVLSGNSACFSRVLLILLLCVSAVSASPPDSLRLDWVRTYSAYGYYKDQEPTAVAVDRWGNIFVTGYRFTTLKYDPNGVLLWKAVNPVNSYTNPTALAVDSLGNAYVTGNIGQSFVTVKYSADGTEQWVSRYNKIEDLSPTAAAIAAEPLGGLVVVGGTSRACEGSMALIVKYFPDGSIDWVQYKSGQYRVDDRAIGVTLDDSANVYVCGIQTTPGIDFMTIKYSPEGVELWTELFNGSGGDDVPNAIAVDREGNVIVSGTSEGIEYESYATVKYNRLGTELWVATYDSGRAVGMGVDRGGNVVVTGFTGDGPFGSITTVRYDPGGNQEWVVHNNLSSRWSGAVCVSACPDKGSVIVCGRRDSLIDSRFETLKYDSTGYQEWVRYYAGSAQEYNWPSVVAVDEYSGEIIVAGRETDTTTMGNYATVKYSPSGLLLWAKSYDDGPHAAEQGIAMVVDRESNIYVAGSSHVSKSLGGGRNGFSLFSAVKYSPAGQQLWVATHGGPETGTGVPGAVAVDSSGNVIVTGNEQSDFVTLKYSASGVEQWSARYDGPAGGIDEPEAVAVDVGGNVYVTGTAEGVSPYPGIAITTVKYNPMGALQWACRYNGDGTYDNSGPRSMVLDRQGNVYITGWCNTLGSSNVDYITLKYTSNGNLQWGRRFNGTGNFEDESWNIAVDDIGSVYVTGASAGDTTGFDFVTIKYSAAGAELWKRSYNYSGTSSDYPHGLVLDRDRNVYVGGRSSTTASAAVVVVKYDSSGAVVWTSRSEEYRLWDVCAMAIDMTGNTYVAGWGSLNSVSQDYLVAKFSPDGLHLGTWCYGDSSRNESLRSIAVDADGNVYLSGTGNDPTGTVFATVKFTKGLTFVRSGGRTPVSFALYQNYPNPFNPSTNLEFSVPAGADVTLEAFDVLGRKVADLLRRHFEPGNYATTWEPKSMSSGAFFVRMTARTDNGDLFTGVRKVLRLK